MTEFTINRENWMTPDNSNWNDENSLVNEDGTMCCLGFYCNRIARVPKEKMRNTPLPSDLSYEYENKPTIMVLEDEDLFADINDDKYLDSKTREKEIKNLFKSIGYKVKFIGKYK